MTVAAKEHCCLFCLHLVAYFAIYFLRGLDYFLDGSLGFISKDLSVRQLDNCFGIKFSYFCRKYL